MHNVHGNKSNLCMENRNSIYLYRLHPSLNWTSVLSFTKAVNCTKLHCTPPKSELHQRKPNKNKLHQSKPLTAAKFTLSTSLDQPNHRIWPNYIPLHTALTAMHHIAWDHIVQRNTVVRAVHCAPERIKRFLQDSQQSNCFPAKRMKGSLSNYSRSPKFKTEKVLHSQLIIAKKTDKLVV